MKVKIWDESILYVNDLCRIFFSFFESGKWKAWSCYHLLEDIHFANIIPLFWLKMFTKPLKRYFNNMSEIHRLIWKSGELMNRKNAMCFHPSIADQIIWNDHILCARNQFQLDGKEKTRHKQKSCVFPERLSIPTK